MLGFQFTRFYDKKKNQTLFERLFDLFMEMLVHTSGDVEEAIDWLRELDKEHKLTDENYTIDDFIEDLKKKGFIDQDPTKGGQRAMTAKTEQVIRSKSLDQIFGKLKRV